MKPPIAIVLVALAAGVTVAPAARALDATAPAPSANLALATNTVSARALSSQRPLSLSVVTPVDATTRADGGIGDRASLQLPSTGPGAELETCRHEQVFAFVDSTTHTSFTCNP